MTTLDTHDPHPVSRILRGADGLTREDVLEKLAPLVYDEMRLMAARQLRREPAGHTLQPTALVHEAYLRLSGGDDTPWERRGHFFHAAARAMRQILIEHARSRGRKKRGGRLRRVPLGAVSAPTWDDPVRLLALDEALCRLEEVDPRAAEVVQLRYFGGLSVAETAEALGMSERTVKRQWTFARAWLHARLTGVEI